MIEKLYTVCSCNKRIFLYPGKASWCAICQEAFIMHGSIAIRHDLETIDISVEEALKLSNKRVKWYNISWPKKYQKGEMPTDNDGIVDAHSDIEPRQLEYDMEKNYGF